MPPQLPQQQQQQPPRQPPPQPIQQGPAFNPINWAAAYGIKNAFNQWAPSLPSIPNVIQSVPDIFSGAATSAPAAMSTIPSAIPEVFYPGQGIGSAINGGIMTAPGTATPELIGSGVQGGFMTNPALAPAGTEAIGTGTTGGVITTPPAGPGFWGTALPVAGATALTEWGAKPLGEEIFGDRNFDNAGANIGGAIGGAIGYGTLGPFGSFLAAPGALIGGAIGGLFGSGKNEDQIGRDKVRESLQKIKFLDPNWNLTLADGSKFNVGLDGGARLTNTNGGQRQVFDVDFNDPRAGSLVGLADPLSAILVGADPKLRSDFTGYMVNAAISSGDAIANIRKFYGDIGLDVVNARAAVEQLFKEGRIQSNERDAYMASLDRLFLTDDPLNAPGARGGDVGAANAVATLPSNKPSNKPDDSEKEVDEEPVKEEEKTRSNFRGKRFISDMLSKGRSEERS